MENVDILCDEYEDATAMHSLPQRHTAIYKKLVLLGRPLVPCVLRRFQQGNYSAHWFPVLEEITGERPLPPPSAATREGKVVPGWVALDVKATAKAWLE